MFSAPEIPSAPSRRWPRLLLACLLAAWSTADGIQAAPAPSVGRDAAHYHDFDIPPGLLSQSLILFGRASGRLVNVEASLAGGLRSAGVRGRYRAAEALEHLLAGTPLEAVPTPEGGWRLQPRPAASGPAVTRLGQVVVVGAEPEDPKDAPYRTAGSGSVLTRDDIERFRGTSVGDIFQGTAGVLVGENRNSGGLDINIRGMQGQGRVPVLIDGARQETTVYRGYAGVSSRSYVDPDLIGGIEISKGATLSAQGTGAIGGLVSMRTLNAEDILRPGQRFGMRLRGSAIGNNSGSPSAPDTRSGYALGGAMGGGSYRTDCYLPSLCQGHELDRIYGSDATLDRPGTFTPKSYAGSIAIAQRLDRMDLVAAYARRSQGNYYAGTHGPAPWVDVSAREDKGVYTEITPKLMGASRIRAGERVVNSNYESESGLLKARFYLPDEQELELGYLRYDSTYGQLMPSQLLWLGRVEQTQNSKVSVDTYTAKYRWQPGGNDAVDLRTNVWRTDTRSQNRNYSASMANFEGGLGDTREVYRRYGVDISNASRFTWLGGMRVDYGVSAQWERVGSDDDAAQQAASVRDASRREYSAFGAWHWTPHARLAIDAGGRYTRFATQDHNAIYMRSDSAHCVDDGSGSCALSYYANRRNGFAPQASVSWTAGGGWQLYASYAEALRMPSLFESSSGFSAAPTIESDLKPEHAYNREIGLNYLRDGLWTGSDKTRLKLAYFRNTVRNYLTRTIPNTWDDTSTGLTSNFFLMRNIDKASFHGVELSGSYDMGPFFTEFGVTRYTHIETCHRGSYRRVACTDYGIAASYVNNMIPPNWHATLTLGARLFERRLTVGLRTTRMGQRNRVPEFDNQTAPTAGLIASTTPVEWHAYTLFDLFARYRVNDRLSIDLNIDNLSDRYYLDALSLGLVPAPGRTARLSMTLQF